MTVETILDNLKNQTVCRLVVHNKEGQTSEYRNVLIYGIDCVSIGSGSMKAVCFHGAREKPQRNSYQESNRYLVPLGDIVKVIPYVPTEVEKILDECDAQHSGYILARDWYYCTVLLEYKGNIFSGICRSFEKIEAHNLAMEKALISLQAFLEEDPR